MEANRSICCLCSTNCVLRETGAY